MAREFFMARERGCGAGVRFLGLRRRIRSASDRLPRSRRPLGPGRVSGPMDPRRPSRQV